MIFFRLYYNISGLDFRLNSRRDNIAKSTLVNLIYYILQDDQISCYKNGENYKRIEYYLNVF